jgi:hypothetical protein
MRSTRRGKGKTDPADATRLMLGYLCIATEAEASLARKVEILDRFGLEDSETARICGCKVQVVRNARYLLRGRRRAPKKKKR